VLITVAQAPACVRANPTVSIDPAYGQGYRGQYVYYSIIVTNNDSIDCGASGFTVTPQLPAGWSQDRGIITIDSIYPGQNKNRITGVLPSSTAPYARYTFVEVGSNNSAPNFSSSGSAVLEVVPVPPPPPPCGAPSQGPDVISPC
jgi:hypothetical protein